MKLRFHNYQPLCVSCNTTTLETCCSCPAPLCHTHGNDCAPCALRRRVRNRRIAMTATGLVLLAATILLLTQRSLLLFAELPLSGAIFSALDAAESPA